MKNYFSLILVLGVFSQVSFAEQSLPTEKVYDRFQGPKKKGKARLTNYKHVVKKVASEPVRKTPPKREIQVEDVGVKIDPMRQALPSKSNQVVGLCDGVTYTAPYEFEGCRRNQHARGFHYMTNGGQPLQYIPEKNSIDDSQ